MQISGSTCGVLGDLVALFDRFDECGTSREECGSDGCAGVFCRREARRPGSSMERSRDFGEGREPDRARSPVAVAAARSPREAVARRGESVRDARAMKLTVDRQRVYHKRDRLKQLRAFGHAARLESVTRAGEYLEISQPAVSLHLRELEHELEALLFERHGPKISLTPARRTTLRDRDAADCLDGQDLRDVRRGLRRIR